MKKFKYLFFVAFVLTSLSIFSVARADNTFVFSTDPQSVAVGVMSGKINLQSSAPVIETTYLTFTSSSPTGQFLASTGNLLKSAYISTGDSNRAVYYEDSTAGDFVITAVISNKAKVPIGSISQHIYVGQSAPGGSSSGSSDSTASTTDASDTTDQTADSGGDNSNNNGASSSANSSPASISNSAAAVDFQISAGRDRLTSVGNDLLFVVKPTKTQNILSNLIGYTWSFGDGSTGQSASVNHAYKFPGQYSVVVNATASDQMAVDRLTVKVVDPQIVLQKIDGGLEIKNNSGAEINLEGWKLISPNKSFIFPRDTLIPAGHSVTFADETTGINSGDLRLQNPLGKTYASVAAPDFVMTADVAPTGTTGTKSLDEISQSVADISQKLATLRAEINSATSAGAPALALSPTPTISPTSQKPAATSATILAEIPMVADQTLANVETDTANPIDQTATVFIASSSPGVVTRIFSWPIASFNFIRNLFIEK